MDTINDNVDVEADVKDSFESEIDPEIETEARTMGWLPKDQFKGKLDQWVDAPQFVERGQQVMPLLLANNKRLQKELLTRDNKIATLAEQLNNATSAIQKLEKHYSEFNKKAIGNAKIQLKAELKQAREDNDLDAELDIKEKLDELNAASASVQADEVILEKKPAPQLSPEFKDWQSKNDWFGVDAKKTKAITRIAEDLRDEGSTLTGVDFLDECLKILDSQKSQQKSVVSKVDAASRGGHSTNRKTFSDLPSEAKQACRDDTADLVGPDKRFKTAKEWEDYYASVYYS